MKLLENLKEIIILKEYNLYEYALSNMHNPNKIQFLVNSKDLNATIIEQYEKIYNCFDGMSKPFTFIYKEQNLLCFKINNYIGKEIKKPEEKDDWNNIKKELTKKKKNSSYYEGIYELFFGKDDVKKEDYSIMDSEKKKNINYIKNLIIFLAIYEISTAEDKEEKFQSCIVYIAYKICGIEYIKKLFSNPKIKILEMTVEEKKNKEIEKKQKRIEKENKESLRNLMKDIISCLNQDNLNVYQ